MGMNLSRSVTNELISAIKNVIDIGAFFPLVTTASGGLLHKIAIDKEATGLFLTVLEVDGKPYRIYML